MEVHLYQLPVAAVQHFNDYLTFQLMTNEVTEDRQDAGG